MIISQSEAWAAYGSRDQGEGPAPPPCFGLKKEDTAPPLPLSSRSGSATVVG